MRAAVRCYPLSAFVTDAGLEGKRRTRKRQPRRAKNGVIAAENARRPTRSDARRYPIDIGDYHSAANIDWSRGLESPPQDRTPLNPDWWQYFKE